MTMYTFPEKLIEDLVASALLSLGSPANCPAVRTHKSPLEMPTWWRAEASHPHSGPACRSCERTILETGLPAPVKSALDPNPGQKLVCQFTQLSYLWIHRRPTTFLKEVYWHKYNEVWTKVSTDSIKGKEALNPNFCWLEEGCKTTQLWTGSAFHGEMRLTQRRDSLSVGGSSTRCNRSLNATELVMVEPGFRLKQSGSGVHAPLLCIVPWL